MKLRRGLGKGKVIPAEELSRRLAAFDADKDGALSKEDLVNFLKKGRVGGPWFCQVLAKTMWQIAEDRKGAKVDSIKVEALGRIIHFAMSRAPRPEKRYVLEPDVMQGYKDLELLEKPATKSAAGLGARPNRGDQRGSPQKAPRPRPGARPGPSQGGAPRPRPGGRRPGPGGRRRPTGRSTGRSTGRPTGRRARPGPKPR